MWRKGSEWFRRAYIALLFGVFFLFLSFFLSFLLSFFCISRSGPGNRAPVTRSQGTGDPPISYYQVVHQESDINIDVSRQQNPDIRKKPRMNHIAELLLQRA